MNTFKRAWSIILLMMIIMPTTACRKGDFSKQEKEAVIIATTWLHLIDDGKYGQSWDESSGLFRKSLPRNQWTGLMARTRKTFGPMILRNLISREYTASLPGAPDGEYVVITFRTTFRNKKQSIETVTPMKDTDGKWRVSGYYIK